MLGSYLKILSYIISHNKARLVIHILGLSVGIATSLLIALYVKDELSFDRQFRDYEQIYRVADELIPSGINSIVWPSLSNPAGELLKNFSPQIEYQGSLVRFRKVVRYNDIISYEPVTFMNGDFFKIFDFSAYINKPDQALFNPNTIMISESIAEKYFGKEDPEGKILTLDDNADYTVIGVFPNLPKNTHLQFNFIALADLERDMPPIPRNNWAASGAIFTYIKLKEDTNIGMFEEELNEYLQEGAYRIWNKGGSTNFNFRIQALKDIHLKNEANFDITPSGSMTTIKTFSVVAVLILAISYINFINLATVQAMKRAREVAVRKALGEDRIQIIVQFLGGSVISSFAALIVAIGIVAICLPWVNDYLSKELSLDLSQDLKFTTYILVATVFVGVASGLYPAILQSSFQPAKILRANQSSSSGPPLLRNILVTLQYTMSISLILVTVMIYQQTKYARQFDLGFDRAQKLAISVPDTLTQIQPSNSVLKNELSNIPGISGIALIGRPLRGGGISFIWELKLQSSPSGDVGIRTPNYEVNEDFFNVFGIKPVSGRVLSSEYQADHFLPPDDRQNSESRSTSGNIVVNTSFLDTFGIPDPESAIGMVVEIERGSRTATIVGVINDMKFDSLHSETKAGYFSLRSENELGEIILAIDSENLTNTINQIDQVWKDVFPNVPITRYFLDDFFNQIYLAEDRRGQLFFVFSTLAILLSCLGLYGLSSHTIQRRTKEIGVRKVLGASIFDIGKLFLLQFSKPVFIACLISLPFASWFIKDWLEGFSYRIDMINIVYLFPIVAIGALALSWLVVTFHTVTIARAEPTISLRYE